MDPGPHCARIHGRRDLRGLQLGSYWRAPNKRLKLPARVD